MNINRKSLYKFPWSKSDNPSAWIEVTDQCDLTCTQCFRHTLEGHVPLEQLKEDIITLKEKLNCESIAIAGGEPLLYPQLLELVNFLTKHKLKSRILTNGQKFNLNLGKDLKRAGLSRIEFHVDYNQNRPGWLGKNESEMNKLRQHYADLVSEIGGMHCAFHLTVFRSSLKHIPEVISWFRSNIHKVQHISLIAVRGYPVADDIKYLLSGKEVDITRMRSHFDDINEITITTEEINQIINSHFPDSCPSAYLSGTSFPESYKFLIIPYIGSRKNIFGTIGPKTIEMSQTMYHLLKGHYSSLAKKSKPGKKIFLFSLFDRELRKALIKFLKLSLKNPLQLFSSIYVQTINIQQPLEIIKGKMNLCDGCVNQMLYKGELIPSCRLDEYRIYGGALEMKRDTQAVPQ